MADGIRKITIKFDGTTTGLSSAAAKAAAELDLVDKQTEKTNAKMATDAKKAASDQAKIDDKAAADVKRNLDALDAETERKTSSFKSKLANLGSGIASFGANIGRSLGKVGVLGIGLQQAVPAIVAVGHASIVASGALFLIPAALAAGAAALVTFKLGADGIKKAFTGLTPTLNNLKASVSAVFAKDLQPAVANLKTLLPQLKPGFDGIAASISGVAVGFTAMLKSSLTTRDLNTILTGTSTIVKNLGAGLAPIGQAFIRIAATAMPELTKLTGGFKGLADKFDAFITKAAGDGRLKTWIDNGIAEIKKIGETFKTIADIAKALFDGLGGGFGDLLSATRPVTTIIKDFVTSLPGQQLLKSIGDLLSTMAGSVESLFKAVSPLIKPILDIANAIAQQLQPVFDDLKPTFQEIADTLGPELVKVIKDMGPSLPPLADAFGKIVTALVKGLSPALSGAVPLLKILAVTFIGSAPAILALSIPFMLTTDAVIALVQALTGDLSGALDTMKSGLQYASSTGETIVKTNWAQMAKDVMDGNSDISDNIDAQLNPWTSGTAAAAGGAWSALSQKAGLFGPAIAGGTDAVTNKLNSAINPWSNAAGSSANGILGAFGGTSGSMEGIGESIVDGLVAGIKRKVSSAISAATSMASSVLGAVNGFLNINSPSKVFRDGPGMAIPEGLAAGIDKHTRTATAAARRMGSAVVGAALPAPTQAYLGAGGAASLTAGLTPGTVTPAQPVIINVHADFGDGVKQISQVHIADMLTGVIAGVTTGTGNRR